MRKIAIPGAILQTLLATGLAYALTQLWGWTSSASLVMGMAISVASTVVLLRGLMDNGLLNTSHGQVAVGWLIFEDLATVVILVLLPVLFGGNTGNPLAAAGWTIVKTAAFVALMLFIGKKVMPWVLVRTAYTRSRELFILAVVTLALGTAVGATYFFDVSLALGAFLAGVVIGESEVSHQVGAEVLPFREIFAAFFFVSVGMLVNPLTLFNNAGQVLALTVLIVVGKGLLTLLLGFVLPGSGRTMLVVAAGLSQIGEFSFLVGQAGVALGALSRDQYALMLAASLISIVINPLMYRLIPIGERTLKRIPWLWPRLDRHITPPPMPEGISDHVVVVGYGRVGHANLGKARALIVTISDENAAELIVAAAHAMIPELRIIARAATAAGVRLLANYGANDVIHPELEGGLEIVRHALLALHYPPTQVQQYIDTVRRDSYEAAYTGLEEAHLLDQLVATVRGMEIAWRFVTPASPLVGKTLAEANLRAQTGASIIALVRNHQVQANPKSTTVFQAGDLLGFIGEAEQVAAVEQVIAAEADVTTDPTPGRRSLHSLRPPASL